MRLMPITDAFFLIMESRRVPMHVGGLNLFTLPKDVEDTRFLGQLRELLRHEGELRKPFGDRLQMGPLGVAGPIRWSPDEELDMDYHIRHSSLPKPGRYRELFALVSRLHGQLLDRSRPLWEMHLIEGLQGRQFATYLKAHHCAIDGVGALRLMSSMYSTNARKKIKVSPLSAQAHQEYLQSLPPRPDRDSPPSAGQILAVTDAIREQLGSTVSIGRALTDTAAVWLGRNKKLAAPFHQIPQNAFRAQLTGARRFVAQSWSFERVSAVAVALDCKINDIVLALCAGALRKQLQEQGPVPRTSMKAMAPVSVRTADDAESANAVGMVVADLATNIKDPEKRLRRIKESMDAAKSMLQRMSGKEIQIYTALTQAPMLLTQISGQGSRIPAFSTVVSNVPGPKERRYWNGARLDGVYPVSIPFDGSAVNFTVVSNHKNLDFGIVACRKAVPHVQHLIDYMDESLVELELVAGIGS